MQALQGAAEAIYDSRLAWSRTDQRVAAIGLVRADPVRFGLPDNGLREAEAFVDSRDDVWWEANLGDILQVPAG